MQYIRRSQFSLAIASALAVIVLSASASMPVAAAESIKKCQDAEGNWHYGDFADLACADSVVDELSETGTKVGEDLPPPSEEELRRKEEMAKAIDEQKQFSVEQRKRDLEVVRIYGSEDTIIATRDRKIAAIDNNINVTEQIKAGTVKDINKLLKMKQSNKVKKLLEEREVAVESYDRVIRHNRTEKEKLVAKYDQVMLDFKGAYKRIYGQ